MKNVFKNIESILGPDKGRYFASGYKDFYFDLINLSQQGNDQLVGTINFQYQGPSRPRNEEVHLGSIEYMTIALRLASCALSRLLGLSIDQIDMCTLQQISTEIRHPIYVGNIPFLLKLDSTSREHPNVQGRSSAFTLHLDRTIIYFSLDHQCRRYHRLAESLILNTNAEQIYTAGYKKRAIAIADIRILNLRNMIIAKGHFKNALAENTLHGIGSARDILLPTDILQVFGQLMQALLYQQLKTDRHKCPNIWLRKMQVTVHRPLFSNEFNAEVRFDETKQLVHKSVHWQIINLSGKVGHYTGKFQIAHQLPIQKNA